MTRILQKIKKTLTVFLKIFFLYTAEFWNSIFGKCWKRQGANNDEDLFNKLLKILYMGSISTRKHEWNSGSMGPISTRKHEVGFW